MNAARWDETRGALKAEGYIVRVQHLRRFRLRKDATDQVTIGFFKSLNTPEHALLPGDVFEVDAKGGTTICRILTDGEDPQLVVEARIRVHPNDHYCKRIGRTKALGVALHLLTERLLATTAGHEDIEEFRAWKEEEPEQYEAWRRQVEAERPLITTTDKLIREGR